MGNLGAPPSVPVLPTISTQPVMLSAAHIPIHAARPRGLVWSRYPTNKHAGIPLEARVSHFQTSNLGQPETEGVRKSMVA